MIKLIEKKMSVDPETFQPMMYVTLALPVEPMVDTHALGGEATLYMKVGQAFIEAVKGDGSLFDLVGEALKGGAK